MEDLYLSFFEIQPNFAVVKTNLKWTIPLTMMSN